MPLNLDCTSLNVVSALCRMDSFCTGGTIHC